MNRRPGRGSLLADLRANRGHPKEQLLLLSLRLAQRGAPLPLVGPLGRLVHRFWTEMIYGIELRPETRIGPGLRLFHGYATVVNTGTVLGAGVTLHQGVTLGARRTGGGCPRIGDGVEIGAGAIVIGDVEIGEGSVVGAGAVVLHSAPPHSVVVGNPARVVRSTRSSHGEGPA